MQITLDFVFKVFRILLPLDFYIFPLIILSVSFFVSLIKSLRRLI